jgi:hypothetical protein
MDTTHHNTAAIWVTGYVYRPDDKLLAFLATL